MKSNTHIEFIYYAGFSDYWKVTNNDLYHHDNVHVCEGLSTRFLNKINRLHNSWKLNKHIELPFKFLWFPFYTAAKVLDKDIKQYAIFSEDNSLSFSWKYLKHLRSNYPRLVLLFIFSNPCGLYNLKKIKRVRRYYDHIITFNEEDSQTYDFEFLPVTGYSHYDIPESDIQMSDLFFVGQDKGRLPILLEIYDKITSLGLKCDFSIVNVKDSNMVLRDGITYNKKKSYIEVLQHLSKTKCVLELLEGNKDYTSIRTMEALTYHKKLITMSQSIRNSIYYSPSQILIIKNPEDITKDFFLTQINNNYNVNDFSPINGLSEIRKLERITKD